MSQNPPQNSPRNPAMPSDQGNGPGVTTCLHCHTPMPRELRFCRNCGFRLGEGPAEYTETVRFPNGHAGAVAGSHATASAQPLVTSYGLSGSMAPAAPAQLKKQKRISGMTWIFLGLLTFFICAAAFTALVSPIRNARTVKIGVPPAPKLSYVGVDAFDTTEGGVTFNNVEPPGSPADKAGLVGGDIITSYDGHVVKEDDEMTDLVGRTQAGKMVDIEFIRDGEIKTTRLTTVSREEFKRLEDTFGNRPEGRGRFGYDDDRSERVAIPGTKIFGVRLDEINQSLPADLAGIKEGDIVIEFDGIPIRTPEELSWRVRRAIPYSTVKVVLMRGTEKLEIPVKMGKQ
jgi:membrane-associated protease RseP (regulator of RpoE activity)